MFRKLLILAVVCLAPVQAFADESTEEFTGRVVAMVGVDVGRHESTDVIVGLAGGVDYNLNEEVFVGAEVSVAHAFNTNHHHWLHDDEGRTTGTILARGGLIFATRTKAYALAGARISNEDQNSIYGVGIERKFGRILASLEYRHASYRSDQMLVGLGLHF